LVLALLRYGVPEQRIFHDLYVEKSQGHFSQIDLVAIINAGIIVFEVKDYSGWIFGRGRDQQWTQVLNYGKSKHKFNNPILQNNGHMAELRKQLPSAYQLPIFSVVIFDGDCELRDINYIPNGTYIVKAQRVSEVLDTILRTNRSVQYTNEDEIVRVLKDAVAKGATIENQIQHTENIKDMLGKHRIFD